VRVIRRAVDGIEYPAVRRRRIVIVGRREFLTQHGVIRESFGNHLPELALDLQIDVGDEIDRTLLVDMKIRAEARKLDVAGTGHCLDRRGEIEWWKRIRHWSPAS
jgi:hypothetical protein